MQTWSSRIEPRLRSFEAELVANRAKVLLPAPGRHRITASLRTTDGSNTELVVTPAERNVGAAGGEFTITLRGRY